MAWMSAAESLRMRPLPNWAIWLIVVSSILLSPLFSMFLVFILGEALFDAGDALIDFLGDADVPVRLALLAGAVIAMAALRRWRLSQIWPAARTVWGRLA